MYSKCAVGTRKPNELFHDTGDGLFSDRQPLSAERIPVFTRRVGECVLGAGKFVETLERPRTYQKLA
jgi:hypothetical protein